ncbi:MAG: hypothetical protein SH868_12625 [Bythopirellula sp.]|nr:hypothetical protein [Bythopirellula sp.]
MARSLILAVAALFFLGMAANQTSAATISPRNPYRSFNISGINYGSLQWERTHRQQNFARRGGSGIIFRRR